MNKSKLENGNSNIGPTSELWVSIFESRFSIFVFRFSLFSVFLCILCGELFCRAAPWGGQGGISYARAQAGASLGSKILSDGSINQSFDLKAYMTELDRCLAAAHRLKDHPEGAAPLRQQLPPVWVVFVEGQRFEISTEWLRAGLEAIEKSPRVAPSTPYSLSQSGSVRRGGAARPEQAVAGTDLPAPALHRRDARLGLLVGQLEALRRDAQTLAEPPPFAAAVAREKLQEILARREFRGVHGPTWLDQQIERLTTWLNNLLNRLSVRAGSHPEAGQVVFWACLLVAAGWLLVWMVRRLLLRSGMLALDLAESPQVAASWQEMALQARAVAGRGNFRDAIRLAYWAGIVRLEDLGLWVADRARTHREYLRLLGVNQPEREPLALLTRQFERAWYAGQSASAEDFQSVLGQLEKLGCVLPSTPAIERS